MNEVSKILFYAFIEGEDLCGSYRVFIFTRDFHGVLNPDISLCILCRIWGHYGSDAAYLSCQRSGRDEARKGVR